MSRTHPGEKGLSGTHPSDMGLSGTDPSQMGPSVTDASDKGSVGVLSMPGECSRWHLQHLKICICVLLGFFFISELCLCAARRVRYDDALPGFGHVCTLIRMEGMKATSSLCTRVLLGAGVQQCIKMYTVVCCSAIHARYMYTAIHCLRA